MKYEVGKTYEDDNGHAWEILKVFERGDYPIVAERKGSFRARQFSLDGVAQKASEYHTPEKLVAEWNSDKPVKEPFEIKELGYYRYRHGGVAMVTHIFETGVKPIVSFNPFMSYFSISENNRHYKDGKCHQWKKDSNDIVSKIPDDELPQVIKKINEYNKNNN